MVSPVRKESEESIKRVISWAGRNDGGLRDVPLVIPVPVPKATVVKPAMLVTLKVQDTQRRTVARTMRRTDKMQGLMDHYYDVVSPAVAARGEGRFVFDGRRVKGEHTPEDLNMVTGDRVDFFLDLMAG
ncbi:hypothetical protein EJB05_53307, partial [Eragrostis curvula]